MVCDYGMSSLGPLTFGKGKSRSSSEERSRSTGITAKTRLSGSTRRSSVSSRRATRKRRRFWRRIEKFFAVSQKILLEREVLDANEVKMIIQICPWKLRTGLSQIQDLEPRSRRSSRWCSPCHPRFLLWWISSEKNRRLLSLCVSEAILAGALSSSSALKRCLVRVYRGHVSAA